jgi:hypothetical protein
MFTRHLRLVIATFAAGLVLAQPAAAGPPLICHPFTTGPEPLLPWAGGQNWHSPDRTYDIRELVADTLELLDADAPVLARMENMRRATIYAAERPEIGAELLSAVLARTKAAPETGAAAALAWFDAGYLVETYRQFGVAQGYGMLSNGKVSAPLLSGLPDAPDGYRLVQKAMALAPEQRPEMELAAALMVRDGGIRVAHRDRARAGAAAGSLLAVNLDALDIR